MGFDFGSFLGGFAERSMEISDAAQERQDRMAEATAKYRLESAVSRKKEMDTLLKSKVLTANKLRKYGYSNAQLLSLANNGRLDDVLEYMEKAALDKDVTIDPNSVVSQANMIPEGGDFDSLFKDAVFGVPDKFEEEDLFGTKKAPDNKGWKGVLFGPRTSGRETEEQYYKSAGFTPEEVARYSSDGFTRVADDSVIDMSPFAALTDKEDKDYRVPIKDAVKAGSDLVSTSLRIGKTIELDGSVTYETTKDLGTATANNVTEAWRVRAGQLYADGMGYDEVTNTIAKEYESALDGTTGSDAYTKANAWANGVRGIEGVTPTPAPTPEQEEGGMGGSSFDLSSPESEQAVLDAMKAAGVPDNEMGKVVLFLNNGDTASAMKVLDRLSKTYKIEVGTTASAGSDTTQQKYSDELETAYRNYVMDPSVKNPMPKEEWMAEQGISKRTGTGEQTDALTDLGGAKMDEAEIANIKQVLRDKGVNENLISIIDTLNGEEEKIKVYTTNLLKSTNTK